MARFEVRSIEMLDGCEHVCSFFNHLSLSLPICQENFVCRKLPSLLLGVLFV